MQKQAYHIERNELKEIIGIQDQIATSFGNFNYVKIDKDGTYNIEKVLLTKSEIEKFLDRIVLVYTGITRLASSVSEKKVKDIVIKKDIVKEMQKMVLRSKEMVESEILIILENFFMKIGN